MLNVSNLTRGSLKADDETKGIIYEGLNIVQIMKLFGLDNKTVHEKLFAGNIKPVGKRVTGEIYAFKDVAPWMVKPAFDVETYIKRMNHADLPKQLTKEFWQGLRQKQDYEEKAGLLWRTEKIVEEVGELMKLVKMSTLLMLDGVERQSELTERQREIIRSLAHGMLSDLMERINAKFQMPDPDDVKYQEETHN